MREFVRAGEVAAVLGIDPKVSEWAIWNRMIEDVDDKDISDRSIWQGRLASEIAAGVAKDHGIKISKALEPKLANGIMPPRAWEIAPNINTNGNPSVLIVMQRTQQSLFGWDAPSQVPEKAAMRFIASAIAYGYKYVQIGILVDGYRSELYRLEVSEDLQKTVIEKVAEMIKMVQEDDEPVVDYDRDSASIREGKILVKATVSGEQINKLIEEWSNKKAEISSLENNTKAIKQRVDQIETILIGSIPEGKTVDTGTKVIGVEKNSKGKLVLTVGTKKADANTLF